MKILHIDPDPYYHQKFRDIASSETEWLFTQKPAELVSLIETHSPDVVLMELVYPAMHGFELLKRVKNRPRQSGIPIIIFSKLDNLEDINEAMSYGVTGFFVKGQNSIDEVYKLALTLA